MYFNNSGVPVTVGILKLYPDTASKYGLADTPVKCNDLVLLILVPIPIVLASADKKISDSCPRVGLSIIFSALILSEYNKFAVNLSSSRLNRFRGVLKTLDCIVFVDTSVAVKVSIFILSAVSLSQ